MMEKEEKKRRKAGVCVKLEGIITMQIHCHLPSSFLPSSSLEARREKMIEEMESWRGGFQKGEEDIQRRQDILTDEKEGKERVTKNEHEKDEEEEGRDDCKQE